MLHILWSIIVGFIVGLIARFVVIGPDHIGWLMTILLGVGGSIVGGLIGRLINKPAPGTPFHPAGFFMSILGAAVLVYLYRYFPH